jgi:protein-disulfide isomerase
MNDNKPLSVPIAIVVAGLIVAGAIFFSKGESRVIDPEENKPVQTSFKLDEYNDKDHIIGNPNAPIQIVEYSDFECYFCKRFYPTYKQIMESYGKAGQISYVYRHFPLSQIHPNAEKASEASECVARIGGNTKFWAFSDKIFETSEANGSLEKINFSGMAKNLGIDQQRFDDCMNSDETLVIVKNNQESGIKAGVDGTPTNFITVKNTLSKDTVKAINEATSDIVDQNRQRLVNVYEGNKIISASGALPYDRFKQILDLVLKEAK